MNAKFKKILIRTGLIVVALTVIGTGLIPLLSKGEMFYKNWWGGLVFVPLVLIVGGFFLYLVIFKYENLNKTMK